MINDDKSIDFFHQTEFLHLAAKFVLNLLVTGIIIWFLYYRKTQRRDYLFTFFMVSTTIFFMLFLLDTIKLQVGFALGLFAIFGILRYRTDALPVREMTYLFAIIGLSVINALSNHKISIVEQLAANIVFVVMFWIFETTHVIKHTACKLIVYEKIDLIVPSRRAELIKDIRERTGLQVKNVEVGQIDFLKDAAYIKVYYSSNDGINTADSMERSREFLADN